MAGDLGRRVAVALVGIPVVLGCLALGGWVLGGVFALTAALGAREFYALAASGEVRPFDAPGVLASAGLVLLAVQFPSPGALAPASVAVLVGLVLVLSGTAVWRRGPAGHPLGSVATTLMGVIYVGGTLAFVPLLRAIPSVADPSAGGLTGLLAPAGFVLLPLLAIWAGDSAAYFVGRSLGRHKLAVRASPKKTVEGALAGLAGSALAGALVAAWLLGGSAGGMSPVTGAWTGAVIGAAGQVGDLAESVFKREAGVKDSGSLLPGHGGILDRFDALFFAFPVTWALLAGLGVLG